jgi:hypothetical protein
MTLPQAEQKVPKYIVPGKTNPHYLTAIAYLELYGNSDEFFSFMARKRSYFSHYKGTTFQAYDKFRKCLAQGQDIRLEFYRPVFSSNAIGGWTGAVIKQNTRYQLTDIERAGHLYHETAHVCGFEHKGNRPGQYDNRNSFPYAVGDDMEEFLKNKTSTKIAGE